MNLRPRLGLAAGRIGSVFALLGFSAWAFSEVQTPTGAPPTGANSSEKTHLIFMGADFDVLQHKKFWRVEGVTGSSFIIQENSEKVFVPTDRAALGMRVIAELKLASTSANVVEFKAERSYTKETDPRTQFVRENPGTTLDALEDQAVATVITAAAAARRSQAGGALGPHPPNMQQNLSTSSSNPTNPEGVEMKANLEANSFNLSTGTFVGRMEDQLARELYDAMEVDFKVSSAKRLIDPYVVLVAQYREKGEQTGTAHSWIYAQQLRPIDNHPRYEHILQGGLPQGFELLNCELHLYNRGQEVGTNVSPKRVELTREEAFEYVLIDYLGSHKGATLSAAPVMGELPSDLSTRLSSDQIRATYFVKVSDDGVPTGVYSDEACSRKINDPYIEAVIGNIRFKPALEKGKAIPGVARLQLNHLSLQA